MQVNISQLNTQKVSPWGPRAAPAKEHEGKHRWHQERAKRGTRTQNIQGTILSVALFAKMMLLARVGSQGIKNQSASLWRQPGGEGGRTCNKFFPS